MWLICPTFFLCNSTGGNRAAARQRFSTCVLLVSSSIETRALEIPLFCALCAVCDNHNHQVFPPHHRHWDYEAEGCRRWLVQACASVCVCVCVCVCMRVAFPKGSAHAVSGLARCCGVTVDLFSSWLHLLEVCRAHKSQGLILLSHSKKREGCDYDASVELWQLSESSSPPFCHPLPFFKREQNSCFSVQQDKHRTFTLKCVFCQEIISTALN